MFNLTKKASAFFLFITGLGTSHFSWAQLPIFEFKKQSLSSIQQQQVCAQVPDLCTQIKTSRSFITPDQDIWLLNESRITVFKLTQAGLQRINAWDFSGITAVDHNEHKYFVFPKLFTMTAHRYAVAIIDSSSEGYSGGGANVERVSFYELQDHGKMTRFIRDYPFSFNRMVRACFSEQDYIRAKDNCHDEDRLSLDIRPVQSMLWQFRYRYCLDVSPASDLNVKSYCGHRYLNINLLQPPSQPNIPDDWNYAGIESIL